MSVYGPIIIIEDDEDDQEFMLHILKDLEVKNDVVVFSSTKTAWDYLYSTTDHPFFILCDINLPVKNGVDFKKDIDNELFIRKKNIPFLFYSTSDDQKTVDALHSQMIVQGFFHKAAKLQDIKKMVKTIIDYWSMCLLPSN